MVVWKKLIVTCVAGFIHFGIAGVNAQAAPPPQGETAPPAYDGASARRNQFAAGVTPLVPEGVNDPECRVTFEHPHAVILVHGTDASHYGDYSKLGAEIARDGWCTYGLDYGVGKDGRFGWGRLEDSARQLDELVTEARASSGADKVQVIGFSQGATVARWWHAGGSIKSTKVNTRTLGSASHPRRAAAASTAWCPWRNTFPGRWM